MVHRSVGWTLLFLVMMASGHSFAGRYSGAMGLHPAAIAAEPTESTLNQGELPQSDRLVAQFQGEVGALSSDEQYLLTYVYSTDTSYLYERSGRLVAQLQGYLSYFSPDEQLVVASSFETNTTGLYDRSGQPLVQLEGRFNQFSPDGQYLTTYSEADDIGRLYDRSGNLIAQVKGSTAAFSANSQSFVTVSRDHTAYLYDHSGQQLAHLPEGQLRQDRPIFVLDDQYLVTHPFGLDDQFGFLYDRTGHQAQRHCIEIRFDGCGIAVSWATVI